MIVCMFLCVGTRMYPSLVFTWSSPQLRFQVPRRANAPWREVLEEDGGWRSGLVAASVQEPMMQSRRKLERSTLPVMRQLDLYSYAEVFCGPAGRLRVTCSCLCVRVLLGGDVEAVFFRGLL